jgi:alkylation response protein AidB-like acyl-CoA dehydrogenase
MDLRLTSSHRELQQRARRFCDEVLIPMEAVVEATGGLPEAERPRLRQAVRDFGFDGINHSKDDGGRGFTIFEQCLVNEQLGRATSSLWAVMWQPPISLRYGTAQQKARYLVPSCRGERRGCFAISEPGAGSDPGSVTARADQTASGFRLYGEKWFVTSWEACDYVIVHAHLDGDPALPTLFLVDKGLPGLSHVRSPKFMHTYIFDHAELVFEGVEIGPEALLGAPGQGFDLTKEWFVEARLQIAAHCLGAATRAAETAEAHARRRTQFGRPIADFQAIEFMIADMAVAILAMKSLTYRVAWEIDHLYDRKLVHARASAAKLFCSETAGRVIDAALQILGGRGYMRENPVERLYRDIRVDRIWEGTSEIQRLIIGGQIRKRGLDIYTGW